MEATKYLLIGILELTLLVFWLLGFVIAKGFWSTLFCFFPFYSWYLVVEFFFNRYFL